jgi:hypothetical protein
MTDSNASAKGPWIHRAAIRFFTLVLAVLIFWVLGFVVDDIGSVKGPDWVEIEKKHLDPKLVDRNRELQGQIQEVDRRIQRLEKKQKILNDSTRSHQSTLNQLLALQKLSLEKGREIGADEQRTLSDRQAAFLENQAQYQALNGELSSDVEVKTVLEEDQRGVEEKLEEQRKVANEEYQELRRKHRLKLAAIQLSVLVPLLLVAVVLVLKMRGSIYFPVALAFGAATLFKVVLVMHKHFPARMFRYILIGAALIAVFRLLVHFIRTIAFPKPQWLVKQYREAYERFLCPVCEYPIRRGPMKYRYWTRRSVKKLQLLPDAPGTEEEPYVCPTCNTGLFEPCSQCGKIRHSLLPYCEHCGAEKADAAPSS